MERRNLVTIGFLFLASTIVLTVFGWGAKDTEDGVQTGSQIEAHQNEMESRDQADEDETVIKVEEATQQQDSRWKDSQQKDSKEEEEKDEKEESNKQKEKKEDSEQQEEKIQKEESEPQEEIIQNEEVYQDTTSPTGTTTRMAIIISKALNVRNKAKKDATVIGILEREMELEVLEEYEDGWAKIRYEDLEGYVYSSYIKIQE